jgi:hypothetical protein
MKVWDETVAFVCPANEVIIPCDDGMVGLGGIR